MNWYQVEKILNFQIIFVQSKKKNHSHQNFSSNLPYFHYPHVSPLFKHVFSGEHQPLHTNLELHPIGVMHEWQSITTLDATCSPESLKSPSKFLSTHATTL